MYFHGDNHEQGCQLGLKILGAQQGGGGAENFRVYEANFCPKTERLQPNFGMEAK